MSCEQHEKLGLRCNPNGEHEDQTLAARMYQAWKGRLGHHHPLHEEKRGSGIGAPCTDQLPLDLQQCVRVLANILDARQGWGVSAADGPPHEHKHTCTYSHTLTHTTHPIRVHSHIRNGDRESIPRSVRHTRTHTHKHAQQHGLAHA